LIPISLRAFIPQIGDGIRVGVETMIIKARVVQGCIATKSIENGCVFWQKILNEGIKN
jgi:hypothetical protein